MAETLRSIVHPWECDAVEHFTTAFYFRAYGAASWHLLRLLGYDDRAIAGLSTVSCRAGFTRELRAGDAYHIESGVVDGAGDGLAIGHRLYNSETGEPAATLVQRFSGIAAPNGQAHPIDWDEPDRSAEVDYAALGPWSTTSRCVVAPTDLDLTGRFGLDALIHHTSDANVQFQNMIGMTSSYMLEHRIGFATFAYRIRIRDLPDRPGGVLRTDTALAHLGRSSLWFAHRVVDATTGAPIADVAQFGVHFDRSARRAATIPEGMRRQAEAFLAGRAAAPQTEG